MKGLTIYDTATGEIKKTILVPSSHIPQIDEGDGVIEGQYDDNEFMVVDGKPVEKPVTEVIEPTPAELLAAERATMVCTPLQGILALGEVEWGKVIAYRDTYATWSQKVIIDSALDWRRNSQNIAFFQYLLEYTDTQVDTLFRTAMSIEA